MNKYIANITRHLLIPPDLVLVQSRLRLFRTIYALKPAKMVMVRVRFMVSTSNKKSMEAEIQIHWSQGPEGNCTLAALQRLSWSTANIHAIKSLASSKMEWKCY
jgi:hypothetical protein